MWQCDQSTLTLIILKIENRKINRKENRKWKEKINQVHLLRFWYIVLSIVSTLNRYLWLVMQKKIESSIFYSQSNRHAWKFE